ncbi:hypothetical protein Tco_0488632 [Tanacetum coccineum]
MLEKHLYDSWKSRMELYMLNRPHGRMILASVEKGPLVWPSITEDGVTRLKEYIKLTPTEAIQADCDIKAINIILQGLPTEIYALKGDDPIDAINHMMSFLTAVVTSRGDKLLYVAGKNEIKSHSGASGKSSTQWKHKGCICYNCKGDEGHNCQAVTSLTLNSQNVITTMDVIKPMILVCLDLIVMAFNSAKIALMAEFSGKNGSEPSLRYKEEVKDLKEMQNVENSFSGSNEQYTEIEQENRNIDREIALEKKIKQLDNIIFKRGQFAQTVHMMTKSKICYDHSTKQAIGFEKPFYLKKVRESKPKLYDGNVILKMDAIVIPDSDETLMFCEESHSKMLLKEQDPMVVKT